MAPCSLSQENCRSYCPPQSTSCIKISLGDEQKKKPGVLGSIDQNFVFGRFFLFLGVFFLCFLLIFTEISHLFGGCSVFGGSKCIDFGWKFLKVSPKISKPFFLIYKICLMVVVIFGGSNVLISAENFWKSVQKLKITRFLNNCCENRLTFDSTFHMLWWISTPKLGHRGNMGTHICWWGQRSHIKVKAHLRSSCKIGWKCKSDLWKVSSNWNQTCFFFWCNMGPFVCSHGQRSYTKVKVHQRSSCKMGSKCKIHLICKVWLEPNLCKCIQCAKPSAGEIIWSTWTCSRPKCWLTDVYAI